MSQISLKRKPKGLGITIDLEAETPSLLTTEHNSYLYSAVIEELILTANVKEWEKSKKELDMKAFLGSILQRVAELYNAHQVAPRSDDELYETLKELLDHLHDEGDL